MRIEIITSPLDFGARRSLSPSLCIGTSNAEDEGGDKSLNFAAVFDVCLWGLVWFIYGKECYYNKHAALSVL